MDNGNHVGGSGNGGFHSYHRSPQPTPTHSPSSGKAATGRWRCAGMKNGQMDSGGL
ncbi:hypothetical protein H5410_026024 [Solanum commersonii]|uniref:Uncharacterized protein n=1 Tax=Solanum commersonii TaxID=4109 RepID=A0A9J5YZM4_SOLCO|nr:hypothetical protein H5410_026024 [Solanum commersonii]